MKKFQPTKAIENKINNLCVKTYLHILGHGCFVLGGTGKAIFQSPFSEKGRLFVDHDTNKFHLDDGPLSGGVLDLASALFKEPKAVILGHITLYRIDLLMTVCGDRMGASWQALASGNSPLRKYSMSAN